ncbi:MAG TPA: CpaF family protein [Candidatus Binataceae bacterium]|nr:CpaF family protein [Candidatus Binataceae bacterium]
MSLRERLLSSANGSIAPARSSMATAPARRETSEASGYIELKARIHNRLLEALDLSRLEETDPATVSAQVATTIRGLLAEEGRLVTEADTARLEEEIRNEILGLGPLEPLLQDHSISDILINGSKQVYVERGGKLQLTAVSFHDDQHLMHIIGRIVSRVGRRVDESSPMVDARLPDGSRVNAIVPPLAIDGPSMSIRRFGKDPLRIQDLIAKGALSPEMAEFLRAIVRARLNIIVCGGTGSGKTTMLNCLSGFVSPDERIVTIEDSAELSLQQPHVVRLETRPPNLEGRGEITQRDLVRNCLRMRPDRIIVGEVRGAEVLDMLQAMSTGHDGSIATVHANSPREGLGRLEMMMLLSGVSLPERAMRQQIAAAVNIFVHVSRLSDGSRKVMRISEIVGMEGEQVMMQDLFEFVRTGTSASGRVEGHLRATGIRSAYAARLELAGLKLETPQPKIGVG